MIACAFGGETLKALRDACAAAEIEHYDGLSPRVAPMADLREWGALLQRAGYAMPVADSDRINLSHPSAAAALNELRAMAEDLEAQRAALEASKRRAQDTLDALAIRIGRMNAHIVRLDALGQRLTEMADLEDGEFDFQSQPPIGGPEETELFLDMDEAGLRTQLDSLDLQIEDRARQLGVLESVMLSRNLGAQARPQGRPVDGVWISSYFGMLTDPFSGK